MVPPKSSILIGFSTINHPFWGYPYFWKHPYKIFETTRNSTLRSKLHESWTKYKIVPTLAAASTTPGRTGNKRTPKKKDELGGTWNFHLQECNFHVNIKRNSIFVCIWKAYDVERAGCFLCRLQFIRVGGHPQTSLRGGWCVAMREARQLSPTCLQPAPQQNWRNFSETFSHTTKNQKTTVFSHHLSWRLLGIPASQRYVQKKTHGIHGTNVYLLYIDGYHKNQPNVGKSIPVPWMVWELRCTRSSNELIISCNSWTERSPDASLLLGVHVLRCKQGEILADAAQGMMACMPPSESFKVMSCPCKFPQLFYITCELHISKALEPSSPIPKRIASSKDRDQAAIAENSDGFSPKKITGLPLVLPRMEWHKKPKGLFFYKRTDIFVIQTRDNKGLFVEDIDVSALWKSCWCGNYGKLRGAAWGENFGCSEFKPRIFIKNSPKAGSSLNSQHMSNTTAFSHSSTTIECSASFCWYLEHGTHTHGIHVFWSPLIDGGYAVLGIL